MAFYAGDVGELRGYVSREGGPTGHLNIVSCSYYLLVKGWSSVPRWEQPIFHKEPFSLDHSVVCLSEQVCVWKPGSEGQAGFDTRVT